MDSPKNNNQIIAEKGPLDKIEEDKKEISDKIIKLGNDLEKLGYNLEKLGNKLNKLEDQFLYIKKYINFFFYALCGLTIVASGVLILVSLSQVFHL